MSPEELSASASDRLGSSPTATPSQGPAAGDWTAILGLGTACAIAYHLHRKGLANRTGPLDWFGSHHGETVARLIRNRFESLFADRRSVEVVEDFKGYWKVMDTRNQVFTLHDFPIVGRKPKSLRRPPFGERMRRVADRCLEPAWRWLPQLHFDGPNGVKVPLPSFPEFRRRVRRRAARHVRALENPGPLLVLRRARDPREPPLIFEALREIRGGAPTRLLVLADPDVLEDIQPMPGVATALLPPEDPGSDEPWRGRDDEWDHLLRGCRLSPTSPQETPC